MLLRDEGGRAAQKAEAPGCCWVVVDIRTAGGRLPFQMLDFIVRLVLNLQAVDRLFCAYICPR